ncbi:hypothetical protein P280DRAFT_546763 [Massarina eburnea CBS 473.64]|uniref:BRCT domain-containing protein n=1 Tax=Massarina eburnea CBS 473.64 TaxID=1395130 RepID=A0A6A6S8H5_9PLEO|nr:hypothetical protein P280DRAFT_546763 [Massarina eburnea CBS 473.64]
MAWMFIEKDAKGAWVRDLPIKAGKGQTFWLTKTPANWHPIPHKAPQSVVFGILKFETWGARLEARNEPMTVIPASPQTDTTVGVGASEAYVLQPSSEGYTEVLLLRNGDVLNSSRVPNAHIVLKWRASEVQVNSSETPKGEIPDSEDVSADAEARSNPGADTEDDEDLDQTVTDVQIVASRATPLPSTARTQVIQETPTTNHTNKALSKSFSAAPQKHEDSDDAVPSAEEGAPKDGEDVEMINGKDETPAPSEPVSNRRRHPIVKIDNRKNKRQSPGAEEKEALNLPSRSAKRQKSGDAAEKTEKATPGTAQKAAPKSTAKGKKRQSNITQEATPTPPRSQRGSQNSLTGDYEGNPPRVVFSNSSIKPNSQFIKFLKSKDGAHVDKVDDECNVLCVKEGSLVKTPKLLQSIALGIPIVTDKWLIDSSRAGRLLPLTSYIPSAPTQEKEWNFSFSAIWNTPQNTLFDGYIIHFTPALKNDYATFAEIEQVCKAVGAKKVVSKKPTQKDAENENTIVLAKDETDAEAVDGACFSKDLLTNSILRGAVDLENEEFMFVAKKAGEQSAKKRGRPKK